VPASSLTLTAATENNTASRPSAGRDRAARDDESAAPRHRRVQCGPKIGQFTLAPDERAADRHLGADLISSSTGDPQVIAR